MVPDNVADGRPDDLFALVCGLYLAAIGGTLAKIEARPVIDDAGTSYGFLLVVLAIVTVAGTLLVRRWVGLAGALGRTRVGWWLAAGPLVLGLAPFGLQSTGLLDIPTPVVVISGFGGIAAATLGFVLASMATTRWVAGETADATVHATWQAPWPERDRRLVLGLGVLLLGLGVVGLGVGIYLEHWVLQSAGQLAVPFGAVISQAGRPRTYRATDRGLEIQHPVARRLVRWSSIRTLRVTDEGIVLRSRMPFSPGLRFDRPAIEDVEAVLASLEQYVDRE